MGHARQVVQRGSDTALVPEFPHDRQALLVQRAGRTEIALLVGHHPQVGQHGGDALPVPQLSLDGQALFKECRGGGYVALVVGQCARPIEHLRTLLRSASQFPPFASTRAHHSRPSAKCPRVIQNRCSAPQSRRLPPGPASTRPQSRPRPQVLMLLLQTLQPLGLLRTPHLRLRLLRQRQEVVPMPFPNRLAAPALQQFLPRHTAAPSPAAGSDKSRRSAPPSPSSCRRATSGGRVPRCSSTPSPAQTRSAAANVQPPANTDSRCSSRFSGSCSRS